ncbi:hypothetical protein [Prevotella histicola]
MTAKSGMVWNRLLFLGGERTTDSYEIRLFVVKRSGTVPCKLIRLDAYHRTITV